MPSLNTDRELLSFYNFENMLFVTLSGIIVISIIIKIYISADMTRTRPSPIVTTRSRAGQRSRDISFTATGNELFKNYIDLDMINISNRYMNHLQSLKFENKLYAMVKDKMEEMQQHNMSWIEVQFLKKSLDILCECRRTLMYTYVFAFYLKKNNNQQIFEVTKCIKEPF